MTSLKGYFLVMLGGRSDQAILNSKPKIVEGISMMQLNKMGDLVGELALEENVLNAYIICSLSLVFPTTYHQNFCRFFNSIL